MHFVIKKVPFVTCLRSISLGQFYFLQRIHDGHDGTETAIPSGEPVFIPQFLVEFVFLDL